MTKDELLQYVEEEYGIVADYPFSKEWAPSPVLRHKDNKKWFALLMFISRNKIHSQSDEHVWVLNVKAEPMLKTALLEKKGVYTAYHMSKEHWLSVILDEADAEDVKTLLSISYDLTKTEYKRRGAASTGKRH